MAEYSLTAESLLSFGRNPPQNERAFARWAAFADKVGQAIFPFIIKPDCLNAVPFRALGMTPVKLSDMVPQPGEMWVLFCYRDLFREAVSPESPLRMDGFPLVLEWRRGQPDSKLLSSAFHDIADRVRRQFGEDGKGWGLHPAFDRYGDTIAFTDYNLFSDAENSLQIASAWGALAAGLHCCVARKHPGIWPFPSIQWDWERKKSAGVAGLAQKFSVAADCGASTVAIAADQIKEATKTLRELKKSSGRDGFRDLRLYAAKDTSDVKSMADDIAWGAWRKKKRKRIALAINILVVFVGVFVFAWYRNVALQEQLRLKFLFAATELTKESNHDTMTRWKTIEETLGLLESRIFALNEIRSRNWMVPIIVTECGDSDPAPYQSCLYPSSSDEGFTMFWIPCGFPVDLFWINEHSWVSAEMPKGHEIWRRCGDEWCGVESLRVAPCGLAAIYEVALPTRHLAALDPFDGRDLWHSGINGRITAFAFSNDGNRFAFATDDGVVHLWGLLDGRQITEDLEFNSIPFALTFSDDDTKLFVRSDGYETICSIVIQEPDEEPLGLKDVYSQQEIGELIRYLCYEFFPFQHCNTNTNENGWLLRKFLSYARLRPDQRTINLFSPNLFQGWAHSRCNTEQNRRKVLNFQPAHHEALLASWKHRIADLSNKRISQKFSTLTNTIHSNVSTNEALEFIKANVGLHRSDNQVLELEGAFLTFAANIYTNDEAIVQRAKSFHYWSFRDGTDKRCNHPDHKVPQADHDAGSKDKWVARCQKAAEENLSRERKIVDLLYKLDKVFERVERQVLTNENVSVDSMWDAVSVFKDKGCDVLANAMIDAINVKADWNKDFIAIGLVSSLKEFASIGGGLDCKYYGIVNENSDSKNEAMKLNVGCIIMGVDSRQGEVVKVKCLRLNDATGKFTPDEIEVGWYDFNGKIILFKLNAGNKPSELKKTLSQSL